MPTLVKGFYCKEK